MYPARVAADAVFGSRHSAERPLAAVVPLCWAQRGALGLVAMAERVEAALAPWICAFCPPIWVGLSDMDGGGRFEGALKGLEKFGLF